MDPALSLKIISSRKAELRNKANLLFNIHILPPGTLLSAVFSLRLFRSEPLLKALRDNDGFTRLTVLQIHHKCCLCLTRSSEQMRAVGAPSAPGTHPLTCLGAE